MTGLARDFVFVKKLVFTKPINFTSSFYVLRRECFDFSIVCFNCTLNSNSMPNFNILASTVLDNFDE